MTLVIPTVPNMPAGYVATATDFNNLGACCTFLMNKPLLHVHDGTGGLGITTSAQAITWTVDDLDTDSMWSSGSQVTVQTEGWFRISYGVNLNGTTLTSTYVQSTTGSNNPAGAGSNVDSWAGYSRPATPGWAGASGIWPYYMYQGDYWQVEVLASATGMSTGTTTLGSWFCAEYVSI